MVKDLREATDRNRETEARQASLISTLRERIHNTEQEMLSIASFKNITDLKMQVLTKENEDLKERALKMESQSKYVLVLIFSLIIAFAFIYILGRIHLALKCFLSRQYLKEWNKTKQEATDLQRKCEEFLSQLAIKLSLDLDGNDKPMEMVVSQVG